MNRFPCFLAFLAVSSALFAGPPLDIRNIPIDNEAYVVAVDIQVNPTSMPDQMLWDNPILLVYHRVENFENLRIDQLRAEITESFREGTYQPVVLRSQVGSDYNLHFYNGIGLGDAPQRTVQGRVCKKCKDQKAYTFSYGEGAEQSLYPFHASIHAHGVAYTIENDGTNAGYNPALYEGGRSIVAPGEQRTYYYKKLDYPGVWPLHDHAMTAHTVSRGLHLALVVEEAEPSVVPDRDFFLIFSDYPDYDEYLDEFYGQTFVPPFIHMTNANVMHAHALNGYAAMLMPRMMRAMNSGGTRWDAMRSDVVGDPRTPVFEAKLGELVRFRMISFGTQTTHNFHVHAHVWWDQAEQRYADQVAIPAGAFREVMFYAGGPAYREKPSFKTVPVRSGVGDWLYHCHVIPHVKHGMWGIFRVRE